MHIEAKKSEAYNSNLFNLIILAVFLTNNKSQKYIFSLPYPFRPDVSGSRGKRKPISRWERYLFCSGNNFCQWPIACFERLLDPCVPVVWKYLHSFPFITPCHEVRLINSNRCNSSNSVSIAFCHDFDYITHFSRSFTSPSSSYFSIFDRDLPFKITSELLSTGHAFLS